MTANFFNAENAGIILREIYLSYVAPENFAFIPPYGLFQTGGVNGRERHCPCHPAPILLLLCGLDLAPSLSPDATDTGVRTRSHSYRTINTSFNQTDNHCI